MSKMKYLVSFAKNYKLDLGTRMLFFAVPNARQSE